jgi:hypothetical protein
MANSKISALTAATTPLAGTEVLPIVQSSATTQVSVANLTAGRAVSALSVTTTSDSTINSITVGRGAGAISTNTVFGSGALTTNSTGNNSTAVGYQALQSSNANLCVAIGSQALFSNTSSGRHTAVGYQAGYTLATAAGGGGSTFIGYSAGYSANNPVTTIAENTFVGARAGYGVTTAVKNTFIGTTINLAGGAGSAVTTGNNNIIIGAYTGSAAPISATGSNYIVLSDGDGNIRYYNDATNTYIPTGNIVPQTAAKGINFTANTPAAGMTSQLLNWYEEGTWTPTFSSTGLTVVYTTRNGQYVRVGNLVTASMYVRVTSTSGTLTNALTITGLPFAANSIEYGSSGVFGVDQFATFRPSAFIGASQSFIYLYRAGTVTSLTGAELAIGFYLLTITYRV